MGSPLPLSKRLHFNAVILIVVIPAAFSSPHPLLTPNFSHSGLKSSNLYFSEPSAAGNISIAGSSNESSVSRFSISVLSITEFPITSSTFHRPRFDQHFSFDGSSAPYSSSLTSSLSPVTSSFSTSLHISPLYFLTQNIGLNFSKPTSPEQELGFPGTKTGALAPGTSGLFSGAQIISSMLESQGVTTSELKSTHLATPTLSSTRDSSMSSLPSTLSTLTSPAAEPGLLSVSQYNPNMVSSPFEDDLTADLKFNLNRERNYSFELLSGEISSGPMRAHPKENNTSYPKIKAGNIRNKQINSGKGGNMHVKILEQVSKQNENNNFNEMLLKMTDVVLLNRLRLSSLTRKKLNNSFDQSVRVLRSADSDLSNITLIGTHSVDLPSLMMTLSTITSRLKAELQSDEVKNQKSNIGFRPTESEALRLLYTQNTADSNGTKHFQYKNETIVKLGKQLSAENGSHSVSQKQRMKYVEDFGTKFREISAKMYKGKKGLKCNNVRNQTKISSSDAVHCTNLSVFEDQNSDLAREELLNSETLKDSISNNDQKLFPMQSTIYFNQDYLSSPTSPSNETNIMFERHSEALETSHSESRRIHRHVSFDQNQKFDKIYHPHQATLPKLYNPLLSYKLVKNLGNEPILIPSRNISAQISTFQAGAATPFEHRNHGLSDSAWRGKKILHPPTTEQQNHFGFEVGVPKYHFSYKVEHAPSANFYSHNENRDGVDTSGQYSVLLPDGRMQVVSYVADKEGYKADVRYEESSGTKQDNHYLPTTTESSLHPRGNQNSRIISTNIPKKLNHRALNNSLQNIRHQETNVAHIFNSMPPVAEVNQKKTHGSQITVHWLLKKEHGSASRRSNLPLRKISSHMENVENSKLRRKLKVESQEKSVFFVQQERPPLIFHPMMLTVGGSHFWANYLRSRDVPTMAAIRSLLFLVFFLATVTWAEVEYCKASVYVFNRTILCNGKCTLHDQNGAYIESGIVLEFCRPWERVVNCNITDDCFCCVDRTLPNASRTSALIHIRGSVALLPSLCVPHLLLVRFSAMGVMKPTLFLVFLLAAVTLADEVEYCRVYTFISNGVISCSGNCYAYDRTGKYIKSGGLRRSCEEHRRECQQHVSDNDWENEFDTIVQAPSDCHESKSKPRTGRPRKINERAARKLGRTVVQRPQTTHKELKDDLKASGIEARKHTISRALRREGLRSLTLRRTPLLQERCVKARLNSSGVGKLHIIEGTMNGRKYREILEEELLPSPRLLKLKRGWKFQRDNDPRHTANETTEWLRMKKVPTMAAIRSLLFLVFFLATVTWAEVEYCKASAFVFKEKILCYGKCTVHQETGTYIESGQLLRFCRPWERTVNCNITDTCKCCVDK
ncbi:Transposase Tc1-like [Trinorchestia longiramus]|nr:Transposase Tc1-like [Trinorchestia longiramus]